MDQELVRFLHELHFDTDKAKPSEWQPDWEDAPLPCKLYRGLPAYGLSADIPLAFPDSRTDGPVTVREIAHFLWYAYGTARVSRSVPISGGPAERAAPGELYRRVVPSGGGLYPSELYVYLKLPELPRGVYHYDAAHHRLLLLREGDFDESLSRALGDRFDVSACFGAVFLTTVFWRNFFKYYHFSYRLQGLDAGFLLGQLLESGKRFGIGSVVCYQFLDRALGRFLGLQEGEESVYAAVLLKEGEAKGLRRPAGGPAAEEELLREWPELRHEQYVRSRRFRPFPMLLRMNEASRYAHSDAFRVDHRKPGVPPEEKTGLPLPHAETPPLDFAWVSRHRYSPENDFVLKPIGLGQLAALLRQTLESSQYRSDLTAADEETDPLVGLLFCVYGAEGLDNGAYRYDLRTHALRMIRKGDHRAWLQYAMTCPNVNLSQVPLCFHAAGDRAHGIARWGPRGYRIQQMETGMLMQRLLLHAAGAGWAGRPLLSYDAEAADDLYRLPAGQDTALIQVPVGPYRRRSRWEGSLFR